MDTPEPPGFSGIFSELGVAANRTRTKPERLSPQRATHGPYYVYRHVIGLLETNLLGNVYFSHHVAWQGSCREMFLRDHAADILEDLHTTLRLITLRCSCLYFAELEAFDQVEIRMRLKGLHQNRIEIEFEYFVNRSEQLILAARGEQEIACMRLGPRGLTPCPVPWQLELAFRPYMAAS
jgi:enediyne biosynthesis thioesterase